MHEKRAYFAFVVLIALLLAPVAYVGSHLALIRPNVWAGTDAVVQANGKLIVFKTPAYRVGGTIAQKFFSPAYLLDRSLRPRRWMFHD